MGLNNFGLGFQITASDQASGVFNKVGGNLGKLEKDGAASAISMQEAGEKLGAMGAKFTHVGDLIRETLLSAADNASVFQDSIARAGVLANASAEELQMLHDAAMNTDLVLKGFSFNEQAKTLEALANETNSATDAMKQLVPAMVLAKATQMDAAETAHFLSDVLSGFGKSSDDAKLVVDQMAFAMKKFGLEAKELQGALMPVIGATKLVGGSFEDSLTIVGLANSQLGNVRKSAVAASMAMNQLADPATAADFARLGVGVKNTDGSFRSMLDILADVSDKTKNMTATQKAATLGSIYNAKTAGGLNIVMDQLAKGVTDASGKMLFGAAAAAELRKQMQGASGAADELTDATLSSFGGQKAALAAAMSSFMTAIGEPIQQMLVPIVRGVVMVITKITKAFASASMPIKKIAVGVVAAVGAFASFIGAALGGAAAIAGIILAGKALLIGLAGVAAVVQLVAAMFLPLILVAGTLYLVWTKNIGGIQERVTYWFEKIKLAFKALYEVFSSGGFSMAVFDELNKAENQGIKAFAINAFLWFNRIKNFFMKLGEAFSTGLDRVAPIIDKIFTAVTRLANRFQTSTDSASKNKDAWEKWGEIGAQVAGVLVTVIEKIALVILKVVSFVDGFAESFGGLGKVWDAVVDAGGALFDAIAQIFTAFSGGKEDAQNQADIWRTLGNIFGFVANVGLTIVVAQLRILGGVFQWVGGLIGAVVTFFSGMIDTFAIGIQMIVALFQGNWSLAFDLAKKGVETWAQTILQTFLKIVAGAAGMIDSLAKIFKVDLGLKSKVEGASASIGGPGSPQAAKPTMPGPSTQAAPTMAPAVAAAQGQAAQTGAIANAAAAPAKAPAVEVNTKTTLVVDGQVLADVVQKHQQNSANRGFAPAPAPT